MLFSGISRLMRESRLSRRRFPPKPPWRPSPDMAHRSKSPPGSLSSAYWRARADHARALALVIIDDAAVERMFDLRSFAPDHAAFVKTFYKTQFNYVPKQYFGRVVVCVAKTQSLTHLSQVEAAWRKIAPAAEVVKFNGTHRSLVYPPDGLAVAQYLRGVLPQIDEAIRPPRVA